jgi:polysaccharide biosynthesis protein PslH
MAKVLVLLPFPPRLDAAHGGGRSTAQLLLRLAERHALALLYLQAPSEAPLDPALEQRCAATYSIRRPAPRTRLGHSLRIFAGLARGRPVWVTDCAVPGFAARLRAVVREWQPDIVQAEYHVMAQYLPALLRSPALTILVEHEPGAAAARARRLAGFTPGLLLPHLDQRAWERYERQALLAAQAVVVFTPQDRQALAHLAPGARLVEIPLGTELPPSILQPAPGDETAPSLLFVGSYTHPPNVEAALRLAGEIFPPLKAQLPNLRLVLVGEKPPERLSRLAGDGIVVTGRVPDVAPYLEQATVVVAPLVSGGGMRVKVLEALAAGKPLVATPLALAGLNLQPGEHALTAESSAEFRQQILHLLEDPCRRDDLGAAARRWAQGSLGWDKPAAAYDRLYHQLLEEA